MRSIYVDCRERISGAAGVYLNIAVRSEGVQVNEVCIVRYLIYFAPFTQMQRERTNVANLHHLLPAYITMVSYLEVIDCLYYRITLTGVNLNMHTMCRW